MAATVVLAVGGGSAIDTGKAVSAMALCEEPVAGYLEGIGGKSHPGTKLPFVAVPTTAGTGSEATKNAVIRSVAHGVKRSLRHDNFVPDAAIVDPSLTATCPPDVAAFCGMDAFTQLLESYVSVKASPVTDALVESGMEYAVRCLGPLSRYRAGDEEREGMSYAALLSGIALANAGLGIVHALAANIGGRVNIPHGAVCAALLAHATEVSVRALRSRAPGHPSLDKYAKAGRLAGQGRELDNTAWGGFLVETIRGWTGSVVAPLPHYGLNPETIPSIVEATDGRRNCIELTKDEMTEILIRACE
jgi:alcohol dehydrogenase class IV